MGVMEYLIMLAYCWVIRVSTDNDGRVFNDGDDGVSIDTHGILFTDGGAEVIFIDTDGTVLLSNTGCCICYSRSSSRILSAKLVPFDRFRRHL